MHEQHFQILEKCAEIVQVLFVYIISFYVHVQQRNIYSFNERETCYILVILVFINVLDGWMNGGTSAF